MNGSGFWDTNFNIYRAVGPGFGDLNFQQCASFGSSVTFTVEAGTTYYIQTGNVYGGSGNLQLNLVELPRPANDDFAKATLVSLPLPFDDTVDTQYASWQSGEPTPSCASYGPGSRSVWYAFTPETSGSVSARIPSAAFTPVLAAYTGNSLNNLTQIGCQTSSNLLTFHANAGTTYYFQIGNYYSWESGGFMQFHLDVAPQPVAGFYYSPSDPSVFDTIQFYDASYDPGQAGIQSYAWDFGDGTTSTSSYPTHKYAKDGDYTVQLSITTVDGRTASTTQIVSVRTHDVAITKLAAPNAASAGQTRSIVVSISSKKYTETVRVDLYKSIPGGFEFIGSVTLDVPASSTKRSVAFNFSYTFTSSDANIGKVTFKAIATIVNARDSYPSDNEAISSPPTKISRSR
jgi:PKD repeat protein